MSPEVDTANDFNIEQTKQKTVFFLGKLIIWLNTKNKLIVQTINFALKSPSLLLGKWGDLLTLGKKKSSWWIPIQKGEESFS